jgi:hypothetical protein
MNVWVEWLDRALPLDPAKVGERVSLFAASIAGTEESTEGRGTRSAAIALIKSCVPVSPRRSIKLIHWFEKYGCIYHADAVEAFLLTALEKRLCRPSVLKAVYVNLLLAFSTESHSSLATALLRYCAEDASKESGFSVCKGLVDAVNVRAHPPSRLFILQELAKSAQDLDLPLRECGLEMTPPSPKQDGGYERTLKLLDGSILSQVEASNRASSVEGFLDLVRGSGESHYRWGNAMETLLPKLSRADAMMLALGLPEDFQDSLALSAISRRLSEIGEREMAWAVAERALRVSLVYGWAESVDGGTRFEAIKALVVAKAIPGRELALKEVAASLSLESGTPFGLVARLLDIIPLLGAGLKPEQFYPLVEDYVKRLSAPLHLMGEATSELAPTPDDDSCERALCELLAFHMVDLVPLVAQGAKKALAEILSNGSPTAERTLKELLAGTEFHQVAAVGLLEVLAAKSIEAARPYGQLLQGLIQARNWWTSQTANRLCTGLKLNNTRKRPFRRLPAIYELALPPTKDEVPPIGPDEPLPDSDNPRDMVRPYVFQLGIMARMARLDEENLILVATREMKQIASTSDLLAQNESDYRWQLERAGLKLPYRRKRGALAREAMRRVASDLVDAHRIHPSDLPKLLALVTAQDPCLALVDSCPRPVTIKSLHGLNQYHSNAKEWVENKAPSFGNHLRELDGRIVLGEVTRLNALDSSVASETRISIVGAKTRNAVDAGHPFERVFNVPIASYAGAVPHGVDPANSVVVRNQWLRSDTDGTDWIALNPAIAENHGWTMAADGLFRWVNSIGEVMVETVWWKDGYIELGPHGRDAEVGEGFLVVASLTAAEQIFQLVQEPTRYLLLQRSCIEDDHVLEAQAVRSSETVVRHLR